MIILAIVCFVIAIIFIVVTTHTSSTVCAFFSCVYIIFGIACLCDFHDKKPKAIDVYQGKTTLEITYRDGVPVDSVVIFKE